LIVVKYTPLTSPAVFFFTASGTFIPPSSFSNAKIETIGGGGGGATYVSGANYPSGGGGGGYSSVTSGLAPNTAGSFTVGAGGTAGNPGGDTWLCNAVTNCASIGGTSVIVGAKGGGGGLIPGAPSGGAAASGVGNTKFSGGNGGQSGASPSFTGASGAGGAAGPNGNGANGGSGFVGAG